MTNATTSTHFSKSASKRTRVCRAVAYCFFCLTLGYALCTSTVYAQSFKYGFQIGSEDGDTGEDVATDADGNVVITGLFSGTADFDPDPSAAYTLTSAGDIDIYVAKYNPDGQFMWAVRAGGIGADFGHGVAIDHAGDVVVTGDFEDTVDFDPGSGVHTLTSSGGEDVFVMKLDANGQFIWAFGLGGIDNDGGHDIDVDGTGNVFITGGYSGTTDFDPGPGVTEFTSAGHLDMYLAKYDPDGNMLWAFSSEGGTSNQRGWGLTVDDLGYSHVSGWFKNNPDVDPGPGEYILPNNGKSDAWLGKYDPDGNFMWAFSVGSGSRDHAFKNAIDQQGNVYLSGNFRGTVDFDPGPGDGSLTTVADQEAYLARYDSNGNFEWAFNLGHTSAIETSQSLAVATDISGNAIITGFFVGSADMDPGPGVYELLGDGSNDAYIASYDAGGNFLWAISLEGSDSDIGQGLATDGFGNIFATGVFRSTIDLAVDGSQSEQLSAVGIGDAYLGVYATTIVPSPPVASFIASQNAGSLDVEFDGSGSSDEGQVVDWEWDFGDGASGSGEFISHTYASPGSYTVSLVVTDNDGDIDSVEKQVEVSDEMPVGFIYISSISTEVIRNGGAGNALSTVLILDESGDPVEGATVSGIFSGDLSGTDTAVTNSSGEAVLTSDDVSIRPSALELCIDAVTHPTLSYDPAQNEDPGFACNTSGPLSERFQSDEASHAKGIHDVSAQFALKGNYPNPFNPTTTIRFDLPEASDVRLEVFDMMGRRVATLISRELDAGNHETIWNARSDAGDPVASGVYLYRLHAGSFVSTSQMILMK